MKTRENATEILVKVPHSGLLSLVASKLKDRVLFPDQLEKAKEYMKKVELAQK